MLKLLPEAENDEILEAVPSIPGSSEGPDAECDEPKAGAEVGGAAVVAAPKAPNVPNALDVGAEAREGAVAPNVLNVPKAGVETGGAAGVAVVAAINAPNAFKAGAGAVNAGLN